MTLSEFLNTFVFAWDNVEARPQPVVLDVIFDWTKYYNAHINKVRGFTNTKNDELYVRAIRFKHGSSGMVEMHMKGSPMAPVWTGQMRTDEKYDCAPGFVVLTSVPRTAPEVVNLKMKTDRADIRQLKSEKFATAAEDVGCKDSMKWLLEVAKTGSIPCVQELAQGAHVTPRAQGWGQIHVCGVSGRTYDLPFIRELMDKPSYDQFWALPEDLVTDLEQRRYVLQNVQQHDRLMPHVEQQYQRQPATKQRRSKPCLSSDSEEEEKVKKGKPPPPRKKQSVKKPKKAQTSSSESAQESDSDEESDSDTWGIADESKCKLGHYAIVHSMYEKNMGLSVVRVWFCLCF